MEIDAQLLSQILDLLETMYGCASPPDVTEPFEMILWENVAYLADDTKRSAAFSALRERVGTRPNEILAAPYEALLEIASTGMLPEQRVERMRTVAKMAIELFEGDLLSSCHLPLPAAKKAMKQFAGIGDPGAEKILLFSRSLACFPLESNGLRVLLRLGYGSESPDYSRSYRSVQAAVKNELVIEYDWLIRAHQLLRRHGQETCKSSAPRCSNCTLTEMCDYYRRH